MDLDSDPLLRWRWIILRYKFHLFLCMTFCTFFIFCLNMKMNFLAFSGVFFCFKECHTSVLRHPTQNSRLCYDCCSFIVLYEYLRTGAPGLLLFSVSKFRKFLFFLPFKLNNILCPCLIPWSSPQLCVLSFSFSQKF